MREGLKWSDGYPLDMESVEFGWEVNLNPALFGGPLPLWASDPVTQNPPKFSVVDDLTWTLQYDSPIFTIMESRSTPSTPVLARSRVHGLAPADEAPLSAVCGTGCRR